MCRNKVCKSKMLNPQIRCSTGSALVIAIFIIVVMTIIGTALVRMINTEAQTIAYEVLGTRAFQAAQTGLQRRLQLVYPLGTSAGNCDAGEDLADFTRENTPGSSDDLYEFMATATEWRTPPLWGLGKTKTVDPDATFLHDGRARTIMEAVLWHAGEAEATKQKVLELTANEREDLLTFLNDL